MQLYKQYPKVCFLAAFVVVQGLGFLAINYQSIFENVTLKSQRVSNESERTGSKEKFVTLLVSNKQHRLKILEEIETKIFGKHVFDISFVAYDREFSKEFGLDPKYVDSMDEGLRFIEYKVRTEGRKNTCYFNIILDKEIALDYPSKNFMLSTATPAITLPVLYDGISLEVKKYRSNLMSHKEFVDYDNVKPFVNKLYLGNLGYKFHTKGRPFSEGMVAALSLMHFIQDRNVNYNVINARGCFNKTVASNLEPAIWIRKPGRPETHLPLLKDYETFVIPDSIVESWLAYKINYLKN